MSKPDTRPEQIQFNGITLTIMPNGYYRDSFGVRYDVRDDRIYREKRSGVWIELRRSEPRIVGADGKELW